MEELIAVLKAIEASDMTKQDYLTNGSFSDMPEVVRTAVTLADRHLITSGGRPDYANMAILRKNGFSVGPGEQDSFGWLTGVITTNKGKIVYG